MQSIVQRKLKFEQLSESGKQLNNEINLRLQCKNVVTVRKKCAASIPSPSVGQSYKV